MKCRHVQKTLVATSGRRKLSPEVCAHLAECSRCRRWQARLNEVDQAVALFAVPSSAEKKAAFLQKFLADPIVPSKRWYERIPGRPWQKIAVAVAASALLIMIWSGVFNRDSRPRPVTESLSDPLLASVLRRHAELATAQTSSRRIETLTSLAEDLDNETRSLARVASADDLESLAALYDDVVKKGIVAQADEIAPDDRLKVLPPIADRLFRASQSAEMLAQDVPPAAAESLRHMARTARDANLFLRARARTDVAIQDADAVRPLRSGG